MKLLRSPIRNTSCIAALTLVLASASALAAPAAKPLTLSTKGSEMAFDKAKLGPVPVGTKVTVTFKNAAKKDKGMFHNFVVTQPGAADEVANASMAAGASPDPAKNWLAVGHPKIIAATKMLAGGESDSVTFTLPSAGDYPFLCSFPGHGTLMRGVITAK